MLLTWLIPQVSLQSVYIIKYYICIASDVQYNIPNTLSYKNYSVTSFPHKSDV